MTERALWRVCGSCADRMLVLMGGERTVGPQTIAYGTMCEAHPGDKLAKHATMCLLMPSSFSALPSESEPPGPADGERDTPISSSIRTSLGPVTTIATKLLVAWTAHGKGEDADNLRIDHAVDTARRLFQKTGGE